MRKYPEKFVDVRGRKLRVKTEDTAKEVAVSTDQFYGLGGGLFFLLWLVLAV